MFCFLLEDIVDCGATFDSRMVSCKFYRPSHTDHNFIAKEKYNIYSRPQQCVVFCFSTFLYSTQKFEFVQRACSNVVSNRLVHTACSNGLLKPFVQNGLFENRLLERTVRTGCSKWLVPNGLFERLVPNSLAAQTGVFQTAWSKRPI